MKCLKKKEGLHGQNICKGDKMSNKDDLLNIGNMNNQNNMKKILIYVAIAFLVFVIGVIGFALIQNNKNSQKETIIPPETKNQPKQDNLFQQIPIENEQNTKPPSAPVKNEEPKNIKKEVIQNSAPTKIQNKPEIKQENKTKNNLIRQPEKQKKAELAKPAPKVKKTHKKAVLTKKYYIQVAALLRHKKPSKSFLGLITKAGYKYKFFVTYIKLKNEKVKVTKILVGPFKNEKTARKALKRIKANITQNAFVFKAE